MKTALNDLTAKMDLLVGKVSSIEKKLSLISSRKKTNFNLDLPLNELISFKTELNEIDIRLATLNNQVSDIEIFEILSRLETTAIEIKESTGFVKNIFVQEKVKPVKEKAGNEEFVNVYLKKYIKSMK